MLRMLPLPALRRSAMPTNFLFRCVAHIHPAILFRFWPQTAFLITIVIAALATNGGTALQYWFSSPLYSYHHHALVAVKMATSNCFHSSPGSSPSRTG